MNEPIGANVATVTTTAAAMAAPALGIDPLVVIGAITGAGIFVMSHDNTAALKKLLLFAGSAMCGFIGAKFAADLTSKLIPGDIEISLGVGAIIASSVSVRILQRVIRTIDSPGSLSDIIKGKRP